MNWKLLTIAAALPLLADTVPASGNPKKSTPSTNKDQPAPDADLFRKDVQSFFGTVDVLAWSVAEGSLDYALQMNYPAPAGTTYAYGNYEKATYGVNPGFRAALTFFRASRYWEMSWEYTRFTGTGSDTLTAPTGTSLYLTGTFPQVITTALTQATSSIHLNYNVAEWTVSRVFIPNPHLRMRVLGGGIMSWISQDWISRYLNATDTTTVDNQWQFIGGGLTIGTTGDWFLSSDFYLTGVFSCSTLMGSYQNQAVISSTLTPAAAVGDARYQDIRGVFTSQYAIGPSWQKNFTKTRVEVFLGFEMNQWWNLQEVYRSTGAANAFNAKETLLSTSVLTLYGGTARGTVSF